MMRAALCAAAVVAVAAAGPAAGQSLPQNNVRLVAAESRFAEEPSYYVTPVVVEKGEAAPEGHRFAELALAAEETADPAPAPAQAPHFPHDVVPGAGGYQMKPGTLFNPGYYHPPPLPFRFPSYPYDNPSYTPFPSNWNVRLPKPWRSDALNIYSDGGRYMQNMAHFDSYPTGASAYGGGQQVQQQGY